MQNAEPFQNSDAERLPVAIANSGKSIYDIIPTNDPLWIPATTLEQILEQSLKGLSLSGMPLRTRAKFVREKVCESLGYPIPDSFKRTKPRFPGQRFDVYVQKSNNLQIWNEQLAPNRRYVIVKVGEDDHVTTVQVLTGVDLAKLDSTSTMSKKYQAKGIVTRCELVSNCDTTTMRPLTNDSADLTSIESPSDNPSVGMLLPIEMIYNRLGSLIERSFPDAGADEERNRGARVHAMVCEALGFGSYHDDGRFPDIRHQLLEVKLQTSPTIDLGLVRPDDKAPLDVPLLNGIQVAHRDVRYAVFFAEKVEGAIRLKHVVLTTGADFFTRFPQFQGKVVNEKNQISLPADLFDSDDRANTKR